MKVNENVLDFLQVIKTLLLFVIIFGGIVMGIAIIGKNLAFNELIKNDEEVLNLIRYKYSQNMDSMGDIIDINKTEENMNNYFKYIYLNSPDIKDGLIYDGVYIEFLEHSQIAITVKCKVKPGIHPEYLLKKEVKTTLKKDIKQYIRGVSNRYVLENLKSIDDYDKEDRIEVQAKDKVGNEYNLKGDIAEIKSENSLVILIDRLDLDISEITIDSGSLKVIDKGFNIFLK